MIMEKIDELSSGYGSILFYYIIILLFIIIH